MISQEKTLRLFQEIGKVLYAIAIADKKIHPKEYDTVKRIVNEHWGAVYRTTDLYGTDASHQIEIVFDWLYEHHFTWDELLEDFSIFKENNDELFTDNLKAKIIKAAHEVAASFAGKNKNELIALGRLNLILRS